MRSPTGLEAAPMSQFGLPAGEQNVVLYEQSLRETIYKLLTFELATKDPWLEAAASSGEERHRLEQNCRQQFYSIATDKLDKLLAMSSLELARCPDGSGDQSADASPRNVLKVSLFGGETSSGWRDRLKWAHVMFALAALTLGYIVLTLLIGFYSLMQRETLMNRIRPWTMDSSNVSSNSDGSCSLVGALAQAKELNDERVQLGIEFGGEPILSLLSVRLLAMVVSIGVPLFYYCVPLAFVQLYGRKTRLDAMAFLYEPLKEYDRLSGEQTRIVSEMTDSFANSCHVAEQAAEKHDIKHKSYLKKLERRSLRLSSNREFLELLHRLDVEPELVRPVVTSSEWHLMKLKCIPIMIILFFTSTLVPTFSATFWAISLELAAYVRERLRAAHCRKWHLDAVPAEPDLRLEPLTEEETREYSRHDGSFLHFLQLMLRVELKYYAAGVLPFWIRILPNISLLCAWVSSWTIVYVLAFVDKITWLAQIKRQLMWCLNECQESHSVEAACERDEKTAQAASEAGTLERASRERLLCHLASAYVNYELFRRQYEPFRVLANFLLFQVSLFAGSWFLVFYLILVNIESQPKLFMIISSGCVIILFNIYLVFASYTSKQINDLMGQLIRLLAVLAEHRNLLLSPMIDAWRRQLLAERELQQFASLRVLGLLVSYRKIIAFNVNLIGLWLLMWKTISRKGQ